MKADELSVEEKEIKTVELAVEEKATCRPQDFTQ